MSKSSEPPPPAYGQQSGYPAPPPPHHANTHQPGANTFPGQHHGGYYPPPPPQPQVYPGGGGYPGVIVTPGVIFREHPVNTVCQHCHGSITTRVTYDTGALPWLVAGGLIFVGCFLGCCLIPFCIDDLKDAIHTCPQCNKVVGRYKRL